MKTPAKILVVEDIETIRQLMVTVLHELGHTTIEAATGVQALIAAREQHPDLILLDLMIPELSGIEVCRQLRADKATQDIRIIIVSGADAKMGLEESIIAGADDFLAKPISSLELTVRVRSILRVRNIQDEEKRVEAYVQSLQKLRQP
jgi:two-component system cell cycle response regulator